MRSLSFAMGLAGALLALPVLAQAPAPAPQGTPTRVRGTVEKLDGNTLMVKGRDGADVKVALAPNFTVRTLEKRKLSDIKAGDYVASTGMKGADGKLHAVEVRIFPEALRGAGEGQFPWDLSPGSMMTNAAVTGVAAAPSGETLTVSYKGTTSEYEVSPDCPILSYSQGSPDLLKPGTAVFVIALKQADGSITSNNVTAEANGIKPPM